MPTDNEQRLIEQIFNAADEKDSEWFLMDAQARAFRDLQAGGVLAGDDDASEPAPVSAFSRPTTEIGEPDESAESESTIKLRIEKTKRAIPVAIKRHGEGSEHVRQFKDHLLQDHQALHAIQARAESTMIRTAAMQDVTKRARAEVESQVKSERKGLLDNLKKVYRRPDDQAWAVQRFDERYSPEVVEQLVAQKARERFARIEAGATPAGDMPRLLPVTEQPVTAQEGYETYLRARGESRAADVVASGRQPEPMHFVNPRSRSS